MARPDNEGRIQVMALLLTEALQARAQRALAEATAPAPPERVFCGDENCDGVTGDD